LHLIIILQGCKKINKLINTFNRVITKTYIFTPLQKKIEMLFCKKSLSTPINQINVSNKMSAQRCSGCFPIYQENQLAHMEMGGCLSIEDEQQSDDDSTVAEKEKRDISIPLVEPLFALPCGFEFPECAICFEQIEMVNVTVTTCGHSFHSSCIFRALESSDGCPMCRNTLIETPEDDEEEDDAEEEEYEDQDDDDEEFQEPEHKVTVEQLTSKLCNLGYSMADLIKYVFDDLKSAKNEAKYDDEYIEKMAMDMSGIIDGSISLSHRDTRTYASVVAAKPNV